MIYHVKGAGSALCRHVPCVLLVAVNDGENPSEKMIRVIEILSGTAVVFAGLVQGEE
jgi:hypothetical protein